MHFWGKSYYTYFSHTILYLISVLFPGLTIETVSATNLIIIIGICVDSPAHITHEFLGAKGKIGTLLACFQKPLPNPHFLITLLFLDAI